MTRDEARAHWDASALSYEHISLGKLWRLRELLGIELRASGYMRGTYGVESQVLATDYAPDGRLIFADLQCRSHYFRKRQAVTFEENGFIGFAGWADDENIQPVLKAFCRWVDELAEQKARGWAAV